MRCAEYCCVSSSLASYFRRWEYFLRTLQIAFGYSPNMKSACRYYDVPHWVYLLNWSSLTTSSASEAEHIQALKHHKSYIQKLSNHEIHQDVAGRKDRTFGTTLTFLIDKTFTLLTSKNDRQAPLWALAKRVPQHWQQKAPMLYLSQGRKYDSSRSMDDNSRH